MTRKDKAQYYVASYSGEISPDNKDLRTEYGVEHKNKRVLGFWDLVHFIDEAHYNPDEGFQKDRVLREQDTRNEPENWVEKKGVKSKVNVHMYAYVNYYTKGPFEFYNDEAEILPKPMPPRKPCRSKYENDTQFAERVKE